jgi:hypothetical protein
MTSKTRHYVDLTDVLSSLIECLECGATVTIPIASTKLPAICPNCTHTWIDQYSPRKVGEHYASFIDAYARLQRVLNGQNPPPVGFRLSLEVKHSPKDEKSN